MGLGAVLVRKVFFSRSRPSAGGRFGNERNSAGEKGAWSLSRLKFCGDALGSGHAKEEDLFSVESSEEIITHLDAGYPEGTGRLSTMEASGNGEIHQQNTVEESKQQLPNREKKLNPKPLKEEDAAIAIQSAFRGFLARRLCKQLIKIEEREISTGASMGTSTEVQAGDSVKNLKFQADSISAQHKLHHKVKPQIPHMKEWDDSTVSSNISKLRIQNRLEAMTRRERALAYAFAQQLRTCSTKKKSTHCESIESNMGWSWLERWMATRLPDNSLCEECPGKSIDIVSSHRKSKLFKKQFDMALDERESCGSNDISTSFENSMVPLPNVRGSFGLRKNWLKSQKTASQKNDLRGHDHVKKPSKVAKNDSLRETEKEKCHRRTQLKSMEEDASSSQQDQSSMC